MSENFIPFRGGADGPAGLLLAINPASVAYISSIYSKTLAQNILRIHLNNGKHILVHEADAESTLTALGLEEYVNDWVFDLTKDVG